MLDKLAAVNNRFEELCARSEQPDFYADPKKAAKLLREKNDLEPIVETYQSYRQAEQDMQDAQELMADPEMKELCQETFAAAKEQKEELFQKLQILLLPKDPNDEKSVIVEIRGGVGGEESALFAHSLFRMYSMYAASKGWSIELMNLNETELGGVKEISFIPPSSVSFTESNSVRQPILSAYMEYIRYRELANSAASSPPTPARISMMTLLLSLGSLGSSRICNSCSSRTISSLAASSSS